MFLSFHYVWKFESSIDYICYHLLLYTVFNSKLIIYKKKNKTEKKTFVKSVVDLYFVQFLQNLHGTYQASFKRYFD